MHYYLSVLRNYAGFSGRARRSEYWYFALFNLIFALAAMLIDNLLGLTIENQGVGPVYILYGLAVLIPGLAVAVRRLHDTGKSGWFMLIGIIPLIGAIWLIVVLCKDSEPGTNKYGPNPKEDFSGAVA